MITKRLLSILVVLVVGFGYALWHFTSKMS
jgi:regulatory protein YycH of two-component signal transduction system YycFG